VMVPFDTLLLLSQRGRAVTNRPQSGAETLRKVRKTPVSCPQVPLDTRAAGDDLRSNRGAGLPSCERARCQSSCQRSIELAPRNLVPDLVPDCRDFTGL